MTTSLLCLLDQATRATQDNNDNDAAFGVSLFDRQAIYRYVEQHPESCCVKSTWRSCGGVEMFPLSRACMLQPDFMTVVLMCAAHSDAIADQDEKYRRLPIHHACNYNASFEVVRFLLFRYTGSIKIKDSQGQLPIHLACLGGCSLVVLRLLVFRYPESIAVKNEDGHTPLDLAKMNERTPAEVVEFLSSMQLATNKLGKFPTTRMELELDISRIQTAIFMDQHRQWNGSSDPHVVFEGIAAKQVLLFLEQLRMHFLTPEETGQRMELIKKSMSETGENWEMRLRMALENWDLGFRSKDEAPDTRKRKTGAAAEQSGLGSTKRSRTYTV